MVTIPILIAVLLILLKSFFKLLVYNQPDGIDCAKALAALPLDMTFLIFGLLIKQHQLSAAAYDNWTMCLLIYLLAAVIITLLWRASDLALTTGSFKLAWLFLMPLNIAISAVSFYFALTLLL